MKFIKQHKAIFTLGILDMFFIISLIAIFLIHNSKTATIDILFAPASARLTINGHEYQSGAYRVSPGELNGELSMEGLKTKTFSIEAIEDHTTKIYLYLTGKDDDFTYYENNEADFLLLETVGDEKAKVFIDKMSIKNFLPYEYATQNPDTLIYNQFNVETDTIDCPNKFCIQIVDISGGNEELAYDKFTEMGFNLNDYEVYYFYEEV